MYRIEIRLHMNDAKLEIKGTKLDPPVNESRTSTVMGLLGDSSKSNAGFPRASIFVTGYGEHLSTFQPATPAKKLDRNDSMPSVYRKVRPSLSRQFRFCCHHESAVFGTCYLRDVTPTASCHVKGDQDVASSEYGAHDTRWYQRTEDGKVEHLQVPALGQQLEDQVGQVLELVKLWREEKEKEKEESGQTSRDSRVKKRAAPPSEPRRSSRPKKPRQL
jgi:hypothetical protein